MSYPRHEYFRRILCNLLGGEMENGELPAAKELVGSMIGNICFANAANYLALPAVLPNAKRSEVPADRHSK